MKAVPMSILSGYTTGPDDLFNCCYHSSYQVQAQSAVLLQLLSGILFFFQRRNIEPQFHSPIGISLGLFILV